MKAILKQYQMLAFVVLTFVLSWFPWYTGKGAEVLPIGPSIAAFILMIALEGKTGLLELLRPFIRWRARLGAWGIALFGPAVLFVIGLGVYLLAGGQMPPFIMIKEELHLLPLYLFWWSPCRLTALWARNSAGAAMPCRNCKTHTVL